MAREEARVKESLAKLAEESKGSQLTKRATNRGEASVSDSKVRLTGWIQGRNVPKGKNNDLNNLKINGN